MKNKAGKELTVFNIGEHWQEDVAHCRKSHSKITTLDVAVDQLSQVLQKSLTTEAEIKKAFRNYADVHLDPRGTNEIFEIVKDMFRLGFLKSER